MFRNTTVAQAAALATKHAEAITNCHPQSGRGVPRSSRPKGKSAQELPASVEMPGVFIVFHFVGPTPDQELLDEPLPFPGGSMWPKFSARINATRLPANAPQMRRPSGDIHLIKVAIKAPRTFYGTLSIPTQAGALPGFGLAQTLLETVPSHLRIGCRNTLAEVQEMQP